jgi:hypothetical protein
VPAGPLSAMLRCPAAVAQDAALIVKAPLTAPARVNVPLVPPAPALALEPPLPGAVAAEVAAGVAGPGAGAVAAGRAGAVGVVEGEVFAPEVQAAANKSAALSV